MTAELRLEQMPLHSAVFSCDWKSVKKLIKADPKQLNVAEAAKGWTPLHIAMHQNAPTEILLRMAAKGALLGPIDKEGKTPLDLTENQRVRCDLASLGANYSDPIKQEKLSNQLFSSGKIVVHDQLDGKVRKCYLLNRATTDLYVKNDSNLRFRSLGILLMAPLDVTRNIVRHTLGFVTDPIVVVIRALQGFVNHLLAKRFSRSLRSLISPLWGIPKAASSRVVRIVRAPLHAIGLMSLGGIGILAPRISQSWMLGFLRTKDEQDLVCKIHMKKMGNLGLSQDKGLSRFRYAPVVCRSPKRSTQRIKST